MSIARLEKLNGLVVDDEPIIANTLVQILNLQNEYWFWANNCKPKLIENRQKW